MFKLEECKLFQTFNMKTSKMSPVPLCKKTRSEMELLSEWD